MRWLGPPQASARLATFKTGLRLSDIVADSLSNAILANSAIKAIASVVKHDNLEKIAKSQGTTTAEILLQNPAAQMIHPGDILKYRKASSSHRHEISGWRQFSPDNMYKRYNVGDSLYKDKLEYALSVMDKLQPPARRKP